MKLYATLNPYFFAGILLFSGPVANALPIASEPNVQTLSIVATSTICDEIDLTMVPGDGSRRIVVASANVPVSAFPADGVGYSAGSLFGTGSNLGNNNFVVYNQSGSSVTVTGLDGGTEYYFAVFEFNGTGINSNYLLNDYPDTSAIAYGFTMALSSSSGDLCRGDSVRLEAHGADQYQWTPSATLSSDTDSVVWARPTSSLQYTVVGTRTLSGCTDSKSISITVYQLPNVSLGSFSDKCVNGALVNLTSGSPSGGVYSGTGVSNGKFNPGAAGVGTHHIIYTYSDVHGCSSSDTATITVLNTPNVTLSSFAGVCIDVPSFTLSGGSPSGGIYSGTGVSSGQFNPAIAGTGQHLIRYVYTNTAGCSDTAQKNIAVNPLPTVSFSSLPSVCLNVPTVVLSGGSPAGGTYSGNGVNNDEFSPLVTGAGTFLISYLYTDSLGCSGSDTSNITVNTLPAVTFPAMPAVCQNTGPVTLTNGTPAGGTYTGTAVSGNTFYTGIAGAGQHLLTYTYTNSNNCTNSATQTMTVRPIPAPDLGPDQTVCANESVLLNVGNFSTYSWSTGAHTSSIDVDTSSLGLGTFPVTVIVTNQYNCANRDSILITFDACTGINEFQETGSNLVKIYPNPSPAAFTVSSGNRFDLFVYDISGALILSQKDVPPSFAFGESFAPGTYLVKILFGTRERHLLIVKNQ
jgi:hypothetical protein